ncbi:hypothetical protein CAEBREN_02728 [Caenorhabditis brenneri]|uniref:F-box domain-containing protein n=1 Tax=Caenorhabditis brenneri TaxID=135651 RepID=G0NSY8_CAEBE|nr:hypothetical protein CAEBREN_02728 [Caenorhabditis brenneri]
MSSYSSIPRKKRRSRRHLLSMPGKVMLKILEKSDYRSILTLRKVSRDLRHFIDDVKPEFHIDTVEVHLYPGKIYLFLHDLANKKSTRIHYEQVGDNVKLTSGKKWKKENLVENCSSLQYFCDDLASIFHYQKETLSSFSLHWQEIPLELQLFLEKAKLRTRCLAITTGSPDEVMNVLPYFGGIHEICLYDSGEEIIWNMAKIIKTEQWKNAKMLEAKSFKVDVPLENFRQFINADITIKSVSSGGLKMLKEVFLKTPDFKYFNINFETLLDKDNLYYAFGLTYFENSRFREWYFKMPNSDKVLKLFIDYSSKRIEFSTI